MKTTKAPRFIPHPSSLILRATLVVMVAALMARAGAAADDPWSRIDAIAQEHVAAGDVPGVVFLVGQRGKVLYRKAFGSRSLKPEKSPMTVDTIFDMASITKPVATAASAMLLIQEGRLRLNEPVATYWPEFAQNGKEAVTIRQLFTHSSGLPAGDAFYKRHFDPNGPLVQDLHDKVMADLAALKLRQPPDTQFVYSDLSMVTLSEVIRRITGEGVDTFSEKRLFRPLGMKDTTFHVSEEQRKRCAPTEMRNGKWMQGDVHDPTAAALNGVGGNAGLFSTADDLSRFAEMMLSADSRSNKHYPLSPATLRSMTMPHSAPGLPVRGLGWDIDTAYSHVRGDLMPLGSYGHTGFTGTFLWIDPYSKTYVIGLSNRVHPEGKGNPLRMWAQVSNVVAGIVHDELPDRLPLLRQDGPVLCGIDVLQADGFKQLQGRKVGLITNRTGLNRLRVSTIDLLNTAPGVKVVALFSPEHGLRSDRDEPIASSKDEKTGLPIYSLYEQGKYKPTPEQLQGIDTLVYDIQDVGVRYYTYITTLGLAMEAAAENKLKFMVLDRPNPINGLTVDGPLRGEVQNFACYYRLPIRHGLTIGELARLYQGEFGIKCDLEVVPMKGWHRAMWFDETGVPWVDPSPNIRNTEEADLYCGIGLLERANVSVGRGTDTPFVRFGAPWIDGPRLCLELNHRNLPGIAFVPVRYTPAGSVHDGKVCEGADVRLLDRNAFQGCRAAVEILDALVRLFPDQAKIEPTKNLWGTARIPQEIQAGKPVADIVASFTDDVKRFRTTRAKYLLYR